jgi:hypothetical protein
VPYADKDVSLCPISASCQLECCHVQSWRHRALNHVKPNNTMRTTGDPRHRKHVPYERVGGDAHDDAQRSVGCVLVVTPSVNTASDVDASISARQISNLAFESRECSQKGMQMVNGRMHSHGLPHGATPGNVAVNLN